MIAKAPKKHQPITDAEADWHLRQMFKGDPDLARLMVGPPRDGMSDTDDELPTYGNTPGAYNPINECEAGNRMVGMAVAVVFAVGMVIGICAIVSELRGAL